MNTVQPIRDEAQISEVLKYVKNKNKRDYILFMVGMHTGLRISDILLLKVKDVRKREHISIREKKTGKERLVKINNTLNSALKRYIEGMEDWHYLFPSRQQIGRARKDREVKPMTRQRAIQIIKEAAQQVGIENVGTHTLRKTYGYHTYQKDKDIATLQAAFNHSSPLITLRYIGIDQDKKDKLTDGLSFT